jgi:asparagine synthase (glutamine-hydrolysing)
VQGPIALGHCALNATPLSGTDRMPLLDEAAGLGLSFDGRIDNRDELISQLDTSGFDPAALTDAELVLAAYRKWGDESPEHLLGDFSYAIWDQPRKRLFCARDHLGVRPFFFALVDDTFICATEISALLELPGLKREIDLAFVAARLTRKCIEIDDTLYRQISRLPMAHCMTVSQGDVRRRRYWDIDSGKQIRYRTDDEYGEHFRELFFDAVTRRLRSNGPVAAMLSGGLDSSGIVCTAQRIRQEQHIREPRFETFSMVFDRLSLCDERPFINEVIRSSGVTANFHVGDRDLAEAAIARRKIHPGLLYTPQASFLSVMFDRIKAGGFSVLLDGKGGDELAGDGFRHLKGLMLSGKWLALAALVRESAGNLEIPPRQLFFEQLFRPLVRTAIPLRVRTVYRQLKSLVQGNPKSGIVLEGALDWTGARALIDAPPRIPEFASPIHSDMYSAIFTGWGPGIMTEQYELLVACSGIELRQPFRDRRLVEFAFAVPPEQLWRDARSRFAFRTAMKALLPEKVRHRQGKGAFLPQYDSVLAGSQAEEVRALFENSVLARLGMTDENEVQNLVKAYQSTPKLISTRAIADLVGLEIECREVFGEKAFIQ